MEDNMFIGLPLYLIEKDLKHPGLGNVVLMHTIYDEA